MFKKIVTVALGLVLALTSLTHESEARKRKTADPGLPLIRDAEIEGLLKLYSRPIFNAAHLNSSAVEVYIIREDSINAFVADGQRMFVNTGLITRTATPNELIGVIAHETGHIAGGHLARLGIAMQKASVQSILGTLLGVATIVGGAAAGQDGIAQAGSGVIMGSQSAAQKGLLAYNRDMEASADQAALSYLNITQQSGRGMLDLFQRLANENIAILAGSDPYWQSHPKPLDRINALRKEAEKSPYYNKKDKPELLMRHKLVQAKLIGFLNPPQTVNRLYPAQDKSLPARYAHAISAFRSGNLAKALPIIDGLTQDLPSDPYFWELKGQALLENGQPQQALASLQKATTMLPKSGLIQILYAQALIATEEPANMKQALVVLGQAKRNEPAAIEIYTASAQAYGSLGDIPRAELATAEAAFMAGDYDLAREKAKKLNTQFKQGSPEWMRVNDINNFIKKK